MGASCGDYRRTQRSRSRFLSVSSLRWRRARPPLAQQHVHDRDHEHADSTQLHEPDSSPQKLHAPSLTFRGGIPALALPAQRRRLQQAAELDAINARLALEQPSASVALLRQREAHDRVVGAVTARDAHAALSDAERLAARVEHAFDHQTDAMTTSERASVLHSLREEVCAARRKTEELEARAEANARRMIEFEHQEAAQRAENEDTTLDISTASKLYTDREESACSELSNEAQILGEHSSGGSIELRQQLATQEEEAAKQLHHVGSAAPVNVEAGTSERKRVAEAHQNGPVPRKGLRHRFADTRSLQLPDISCELANHWFPIAFAPHALRGNEQNNSEWRPWRASRRTAWSGFVITGKCRFFGRDWTIWAESDGSVRCRAYRRRFGEVELPEMAAQLSSGMVWAWPGVREPKQWMLEQAAMHMSPPDGYTVHAELELEMPVDHGLLVENLVDLAHAPFTHTSTFARGWDVPSVVRFAFFSPSKDTSPSGTKRRNKGGPSKSDTEPGQLSGRWDPYPIDMRFEPPCLVQSLISVDKPGASGGGAKFTNNGANRHVHQVHACLPSDEGKTRLLYRLSLDFAHWLRHVPLARDAWKKMAEAVLEEDRRLVVGQQDRMRRGGRVWGHPVGYDAMALQYRRWRNEAQGLEFKR